MFTKINLKHCSSEKYGVYTTISAAQNACSADSNCKGVYDQGCDAGANDIYLCPVTATYQTSGSSCIYEKLGKIKIFENILKE